MPGANGLMAASFASQSLSSIGTSFNQSQALEAKANYESSADSMNAKLADLRSEDAIKRGFLDSNAALKKGAQVRGGQRAALAAQGIDVNSGSAADVQSETDLLSRQDAETISNNAWREAFGFKSEAQQYRNRAEMTTIAGKSAARSTLLTGGMQALGYGLQAGAYAGGYGRDLKVASEEEKGKIQSAYRTLSSNARKY